MAQRVSFGALPLWALAQKNPVSQQTDCMAENDKKAAESADKPPEAPPPKVTKEEHRRPGRRRVIVFTVLLVAIVVAIVLYAVRLNSPYRSTEDAYVHGNQIFLT